MNDRRRTLFAVGFASLVISFAAAFAISGMRPAHAPRPMVEREYTCSEIGGLFEELRAGRLNDVQRKVLCDHVFTCHDCREEFLPDCPSFRWAFKRIP